MTRRPEETESFAAAVMARLDGVESKDRKRWLDRDARHGLWAVGCLFAVAVFFAGVSWMAWSPVSTEGPSASSPPPAVQDAFRRLSVDPVAVPGSADEPLENSDGSATSEQSDRYESTVAAGPGRST